MQVHSDRNIVVTADCLDQSQGPGACPRKRIQDLLEPGQYGRDYVLLDVA